MWCAQFFFAAAAVALVVASFPFRCVRLKHECQRMLIKLIRMRITNGGPGPGRAAISAG